MANSRRKGKAHDLKRLVIGLSVNVAAVVIATANVETAAECLLKDKRQLNKCAMRPHRE